MYKRQGRDSPNTRQLVVEHGGFDYDSDYYGDDLPFWSEVACSDGSRRPHLIVPYTLDANDMRFATAQGFNTAEQFYTYLKDSFDVLYAEGETAPKMMSVGMHCRLLGRPGRFRALQRFLDYIPVSYTHLPIFPGCSPVTRSRDVFCLYTSDQPQHQPGDDRNDRRRRARGRRAGHRDPCGLSPRRRAVN